VKKLLDAGADVNMGLGSGRRALHIAADKGNRDMVTLLLERGAKTDIVKDYGWAPIHDAAYRGHFDVVVALLKAGANPNLRTAEGKTAYGWAVAREHPEVAELLAPYMKKVVDLAVENDLKIPAAPEPPAGWVRLSDSEIARSVTHAKLGYRLTDIFNFQERERIRIVNNLATRADQVQTMSFDDFTDGAAIETARQELLKRGGNAPAEGPDLRKLPRPPGI
jgi:hypothetical protein